MTENDVKYEVPKALAKDFQSCTNDILRIQLEINGNFITEEERLTKRTDSKINYNINLHLFLFLSPFNRKCLDYTRVHIFRYSFNNKFDKPVIMIGCRLFDQNNLRSLLLKKKPLNRGSRYCTKINKVKPCVVH